MANAALTEPFDKFQAWFEEAGKSEPADPNAMTLATVGADGRPTARMVLLKDATPQGFTFYTNLESRKGEALKTHPFAALCFHWKSLKRQVRIEGAVQPVEPETADAYFASRHRASQIGAWASRQSRELENRFALEKHVAEFTAKFGFGKVTRPPFWSGFLLVPDRIEFWEERPFRLHERVVYQRQPDGWATSRLYP